MIYRFNKFFYLAWLVQPETRFKFPNKDKTCFFAFFCCCLPVADECCKSFTKFIGLVLNRGTY